MKTADELKESKEQKKGELGEDEDAKTEKHHKELNDDSVVSLTDLLESANQDESIPRWT